MLDMFTEVAAENRPSMGNMSAAVSGVQATLGPHCQPVILLGRSQQGGFGAREGGELVGD